MRTSSLASFFGALAIANVSSPSFATSVVATGCASTGFSSCGTTGAGAETALFSVSSLSSIFSSGLTTASCSSVLISFFRFSGCVLFKCSTWPSSPISLTKKSVYRCFKIPVKPRLSGVMYSVIPARTSFSYSVSICDGAFSAEPGVACGVALEGVCAALSSRRTRFAGRASFSRSSDIINGRLDWSGRVGELSHVFLKSRLRSVAGKFFAHGFACTCLYSCGCGRKVAIERQSNLDCALFIIALQLSRV